MRQYLFSLLLLPYMAQGQTSEPDTVSVRDLGEITVIAAAQRTEATKTVYIPTERQKDTASDGLSLLARMNIPQLSINPVAETVKTAGEQEVSLFINSHPASEEDIAGLNPADVRKVEYLDFPSDPRFLRAQHVVNFITYEYTSGGYTRLNGKERFMINSGEASVYSKFAYRAMEYDFMVSCDYDYNSHIGSATEETYRFENISVKRESSTESGKHHERSLFAGLRASWNKSQNFSFRNLISYRRQHTPVNKTTGYVRFSDLYNSEYYTAEAPFTNNAVSWNSELYASLSKGWALNGNLHTEIVSSHTTDNYIIPASEIRNQADEDSWYMNGNIQVNKSVSDRISLFTNITSAGGNTNIDYSGTSNATNKFNQTFTGIYLGIALNFRKVAGTIDGGYAFESNSINGQRIDDRYPFTHINVQYALNQKNSLSLWFQYATMSPGATMKNPNIIRQSELMYIAGNPNLKCSRHISANLSYLWLPSNQWQLSAYAVFFRIANRQIAVYSPDGPDGMMLKKYQNDGDYNHGQIGLQLTGKSSDGKLTVTLAPRLLLYKTTGSNSISHYPFTCSLNTDYYLGNFFLNAYWSSRSSYVDGETAYLRKMPSDYSVGAGWAASGWNIQLSLVNMFQSSWRLSTDTLNTRWYDSTMIQYDSYSHRRITLNITYTFNYGKRVTKTNELNGDTNISTSILR
ncbi:MAG: outer membrane beta-barrel family protein [Muribaculaceae bacterium]|nr:outer membrane beta-barrel family protein [Muribaculaceae bacterium]